MTTLAPGLDFVDLRFLGHPEIIATAVLHGVRGVALLDPGPSTSLDNLRAALVDKGIAITDIRQILLTHIHLDHAGATGTLAAENPAIEVLVHEVGAPHVVDPRRLLASATRLYGVEGMDRLWGAVLPVPASQVRPLKGGERIDAVGRELQVAFTPGHASHHVSYFDRAAAGQFSGLDVGTTVRWGEGSWNVVGIFETDGSVAESEIWCDARVLQPAYRRGNSYQSVLVMMDSPDSFQTLKDSLTADQRLNVTAMREREYFAQQSQVLQSIIRTIGFGIAFLMGLGAVFGAVNTMYSAVSSRTREIATLRALGFGRSPVVVSVLVEAVLLSVVGGLLGGGLAWLIFDGYQTATMNWQSFSQVAFAFSVTPELLGRGLGYAVLMGFLGGLFPAVRAARLPVVSALRQL